MDKGLNKAFEKLTEALQYTRDKDANTTAMYDVLAVLCQLKPKSKNIYKLTDIEEVVDE